MITLPFETYFDEMPCYVSVQDRELKLIAANRRFRDDFGDIEGRYCYQVYKHRPEKCEICPVERSFHDGQPHRSEEVVTCLNGTDVSVLVNTTPIMGEDGAIEAVMEMSTDVTELTRLQAQLRESRRKYRMLFDEVPCFISIQDRELNVLDANRLHRETFGEKFGGKCYELYKHRSTACTPCIVHRTFADGELHVHEEVVATSDDRTLNVLVHTAPLRNELGEIDSVIEISTDITPVRQLQDQLTSIGLLISSISHGIKGLLNGLDGGVYLVNSGMKTDRRERIEEGWEIVLRNVLRIRSMVLDILYYARDRELNLESMAAAEFFEQLAEVIQPRAGELGIALDIRVDESAGEFTADFKALRSTFVNLVENALDACRVDRSKDDHHVAISARGDGPTVTVTIRDNGIGMDRETRDKAFSLFFSSKGTEGTGLGLFIADKIVTSHGGNVHLDSTEGEGSTFTVELPRTPTPEKAPAPFEHLEVLGNGDQQHGTETTYSRRR